MVRGKKKENTEIKTVSPRYSKRVRRSINYNENSIVKKTATEESDSDFEVEPKRKGKQAHYNNSSSDDDMPLKTIKNNRKNCDKVKDKEDKVADQNCNAYTDITRKPSSFVNISRLNLSEGESSDSSDDDMPLAKNVFHKDVGKLKDESLMNADVSKNEEKLSSSDDDVILAETNFNEAVKAEINQKCGEDKIDSNNTSDGAGVQNAVLKSVEINRASNRKTRNNKKVEELDEEDMIVGDSEDELTITSVKLSSTVGRPLRKRTAKIGDKKRKASKVMAESSSEASDDNWEDVDEIKLKKSPKKRKKVKMEKVQKTEIKDVEPEIKDVEIKVGVDSIHTKKNKKSRKEKMFMWMRQLAGRIQRETQILLHKCHLLCLLAQVLEENRCCDRAVLKGVCLSLIPIDYFKPTCNKWDVNHLRRFTNWFQREVPSVDEIALYVDQKRMNVKKLKRIHIYVIMLRSLGFLARVIYSLQPCTAKVKKTYTAQDEENKSPSSDSKRNSTANTKKGGDNESKKSKAKSINREMDETKSPYFFNDTTPKSSAKKRDSKKARKSNREHCKIDYKEGDSEMISESDNEFAVERKLKSALKLKNKGKTRRRSEHETTENSFDTAQDLALTGNDIWAEIYMQTLKKWICVEMSSESINSPEKCEQGATKPLQYVIGIDNNGKIKDVTCRYAEKWLTVNRKLRVDREWWAESISPYKPPENTIDASEDAQMRQSLMQKELPKTVSECKDHPLYALQRHLLKFQAIYPPDAAPVGYLRKEPIYPRDCVHELHTKETWMKKARSVIPGEIPYKIVKGRPKWRDRHMNQDIKTPCFGLWQTEIYVPPPVIDGKITKNEYGNIELFQPSMLPEGAVHIPMTNMVKIARKLKIDYAPAMMGWDFHSGFSHPVFEGIVAAKEYEDILIDAWNKEEEDREKREAEKREKAIYDNWKKLIKGLLIRARLKDKYSFEEEETEEIKSKGKKKPSNSKKAKEKSTSVVINNEEDEECTNLSAAWPMNKLDGLSDLN